MKIRKNLMFIYMIFIFCFLLWYNYEDKGVPHIDFDNIAFNLKNHIGYNIKIFHTITNIFHSLNHYYIDVLYYYIIGNIFLYIPLGFFAFINSSLKKSKFVRSLILCLLFCFIKEIIQFLFDIGSFDIDTIILNITGILIGSAVSHIYFKYFKSNITSFF